MFVVSLPVNVFTIVNLRTGHLNEKSPTLQHVSNVTLSHLKKLCLKRFGDLLTASMKAFQMY